MKCSGICVKGKNQRLDWQNARADVRNMTRTEGMSVQQERTEN